MRRIGTSLMELGDMTWDDLIKQIGGGGLGAVNPNHVPSAADLQMAERIRKWQEENPDQLRAMAYGGGAGVGVVNNSGVSTAQMGGDASSWFDGWDLDSEGNRIRFNPRTTQMGGVNYVPISGTPDEYKAIPAYSQILKDPTAFKQGPDGQWYMSTEAQGKTSSVMERTGGLGKMLNNGAGFWALAGPMLAGTLGGAFPGVNAAGTAIPAGQTGILSQLGIQNPFSNLFGGNQTPGVGTGDLPSQTWGVNQRGGGLFDMAGGLAEDAGMSMNDWVAQQVAAGGGDLPSVFGAASPMSGLDYADMIRNMTEKSGPAAATSTIGRILSGEAGADDYMKLLGALGSSALGYLGAESQANALSGVSDKYLALGQPYRAKLASTFDPSFDLMNEPGFKNAMDVSSKGVLANLSAKVGNPYDQPGAVTEAQKYIMGSVALPQLNTLRSQLGTFGQLGTNIAGTADMAGAGNAGQGLDALGLGLSQLTGNNNDLESILKKYGGLLGNTRLNLPGSSI